MSRSEHRARWWVLVALISGLALIAGVATAALINDSGTHNVEVADREGFAEATLDNAIVQYIGDLNETFGASGSGVFDAFVRLQAEGTESGFNTGSNKLELDTKHGAFTHEMLLSEIPTVIVDGLPYWELFADINDSDNTPLISLDDVELWLTSNPDLVGYPFTEGGADNVVHLYDFDGSILINDVNQGSGRGDLRYLVAQGAFDLGDCDYANPDCETYLVLYSAWGGDTGGAYGSDGGFEEWKVKRYAIKSGVKFHDLNANGVKDAGEPGLAGFTIYVDLNENGEFESDTEPNVVTDASGFYSFILDDGTYDVREVCPAATPGWRQSLPAPTSDAVTDCGTGFYDEVTLKAPQAETDNDFGNYRDATKAGVKFNDLNANGSKDDGEPGLNGWVIRAYADLNANGVLDAAEFTAGPVASSTTATVDSVVGTYSMSLTPGSYIICEVLQAGSTQSFPTGAPAECAASTTLGAQGYGITLTSGQVDNDNHFGNFQQITLSGLKYKDVNADGNRDPDGEDTDPAATFDDEVGLSGWTIRLYSDNGSVPGSLDETDTLLTPAATTAADGSFSFTVNPGSYLICEVAQTDWAQTQPDPTTNTICTLASSGNALGGYARTVASGDGTVTGNDFGNTPLSNFDVRFFDLTGATDATISCTNTSATSTTDEALSPETKLEANGVEIGTYVCTIVITDP